MDILELVKGLNLFTASSIMLGVYLYFPLALQIRRGTVTQSLATYVLWFALDATVGFSLLARGGSYGLPLAYAAGSFIIITSILKSKDYGTWTMFEVGVSVMVIVSLVVWEFAGSRNAAISATAGMLLAGLPLVSDSWKSPEKAPLGVYVGYTTANTLNCIGANAWTVEERLYSFSCAVLCIVLVVITVARRGIALPEEVETR